MSYRPCKAINDFGPKPGKYTKDATVAETIAREQRRLKAQAEPKANVTVMRRAK